MTGALSKYSDPVHGFIELSHVEQQVVSSEWFRRLQNVRQLGALAFVFPAATHTRFAHALGAMEYAGSFFDGVEQGVDELPVEDPDHARKLSRVCGLLHDIGHPPFSHNLEDAFKEEVEGAVPEGEEPTDTEFHNHDLFNGLPVDLQTIDPWDHETIGHVIIMKSGVWEILEDQGIGREVIQVLEGQHDAPFLNQLISSGLDCDKMDYLQRDSQALQLGYGMLDAEQLIGEMTLYQENLALEESGLTALHHFLTARYLWYSGILYQPKVDVLENLVSIAYRELTKRNDDGEPFLPNLETYLGMVDGTLAGTQNPEDLNFFRFDDTYVITKFHEARDRLQDLDSEGDTIPDSSLKNILKAVVRGEPFSLVCQVDSVERKGDERSDPSHPAGEAFYEFWEYLEDEHEDDVNSDRILLSEPNVDLVKGEDEQPRILTGSVDHVLEPRAVISHPSSFLNHLGDGPDAISEEIPLSFWGRRIYADPSLEDKLTQEWEARSGGGS